MESVSVILATYRRDFFLHRALDSLMGQTYREIEIIVVDDNADADWNGRVSDILKDFPHVRYIKNEINSGSAKSRNIGIAAAKGEYVTFLDDDDEYLPEKVERQVAFMRENGLDFCVTDLMLYNEDGRLIDKRIRSYINDASEKALFREHLLHHITGTDTMMFKKSYLESIGGFDEIDVGDEFYLMAKAIKGNGKFGYLPECSVKAYVHTVTDGLSSGDSKINGENGLYEYKKQWFRELDGKSVRYIKMRHYAVLSFAELRRKRYGAFIKNGFFSFVIAPIKCVKLLVKGEN